MVKNILIRGKSLFKLLFYESCEGRPLYLSRFTLSYQYSDIAYENSSG